MRAGRPASARVVSFKADPPARQMLRSTAAHNTLRIDGEDSSRLAGSRWLWQIANDAHPRVLEWTSTAERDVLVAEHDGYRRLRQPVMHRRTIEFWKQEFRWRIVDDVFPEGEHLLELFFHPGVAPEFVDDAVRLCAPRGDLWLFPPRGLTQRQEAGWISGGYGLRQAATVLVYQTRVQAPVQLTTTLLLVPTGTSVEKARLRLS